MKTEILFTLCLSMFCLPAVCQKRIVSGNGVIKKVYRNLPEGISKVEVAGSYQVILTKAHPDKILIWADENLIPYIRAEKKGDRLEIYTEENTTFRNHSPLKVYVPARGIESFSLTGSGSVQSDHELKLGKVEMEIAGSGEIALQNLRARKVEVEITGSGEVKLSGTADDLSLDISGSGRFQGRRFNVDRAKIEVVGSGKAEVFAKKTLDIELSGSGSVYYLGSPTLSVDKVGSGSVERIGR